VTTKWRTSRDPMMFHDPKFQKHRSAAPYKLFRQASLPFNADWR
jgi:hypothetical protein